MDDIIKQREQIDNIDKEIMSLLEERFKCVEKIKQYKKEKGVPISHPNRENEILESINSDFLYKQQIEKIYMNIFKVSKEMQVK